MMRRTLSLTLSALLAAGALSATRADAETITDVRITMDDGVRLAADIYIPSIADADGDGLYPCVVELTPYRKESRASEGASFLPGQGIALIEVDARGTGGSEGEYDIVFSVREQADAAALVDWAATEARKPNGDPLCEETVGMFGGSYSGIIQYLVASLPEVASEDLPAAPRHLAAIAPQRAYGDLYRDIVYHGGIIIGSFGTIWSAGTSAYYVEPPTDIDSEEGQSAWLDHLTGNDPMIVPYLRNVMLDARFTSDDSDPQWSQDLYLDSSVLPRIENLKVPALHLAGWFDSFTRGQVLTFQKAYDLEQRLGDRGPNHLIVGPWNHSGTHFISPDHGLRPLLASWYLHWLEGAANGDPEPDWGARVRYFQMRTGTVNADAASDGSWEEAADWPVDSSINVLPLGADGVIGSAETGDRLYVSGNQTSGVGEVLSRWDNAAGTPQPQLDQRLENGRGLTWTMPLEEDLTVTGPISMQVKASVTSVPGGVYGTLGDVARGGVDTDFVVKVSEVAPDGSARLVTQGFLRASHVDLIEDPTGYQDGHLMRPVHRHVHPLYDPRNGTRDYEIEIWPTAKTFRAGHSLRVDLLGADTPNHLTLVKPALVTVHSALLRLPVR